jgi:hypothetical protein
MKMREAPWTAAVNLPPWNPLAKAVATATALQGAFGAGFFRALRSRNRKSKFDSTFLFIFITSIRTFDLTRAGAIC